MQNINIEYLYLTKDEQNELVARALKNDEVALQKLYTMHKPILYKVAKKVNSKLSHEDIEDEILTFMGKILILKLPLFDNSKSKFSTWVTISFKRHLYTLYRRNATKEINTVSLDEYTPQIRNSHALPKNAINLEFKGFGETKSILGIARLIIKIVGLTMGKAIIYRHYYGLQAQECERKVNIPRGSYKYYERKAFNMLKNKLNRSDYLD